MDFPVDGLEQISRSTIFAQSQHKKTIRRALIISSHFMKQASKA